MLYQTPQRPRDRRSHAPQASLHTAHSATEQQFTEKQLNAHTRTLDSLSALAALGGAETKSGASASGRLPLSAQTQGHTQMHAQSALFSMSTRFGVFPSVHSDGDSLAEQRHQTEAAPAADEDDEGRVEVDNTDSISEGLETSDEVNAATNDEPLDPDGNDEVRINGD